MLDPSRRRARDLARRELEGEAPPFLPMPHPLRESRAGGRVTPVEWELYRQRLARQREVEPDYDAKCGRPSGRRANNVWNLIAPSFGPFPGLELPQWKYKWLTAEEVDEELPRVMKQAFLVALDTFVRAGLEHRMATSNTLFDALARRWSDHYRNSIARTTYDMSRERVMRSRRDLLLNGINIAKLWRFVMGEWSEKDGWNPLFWRRRVEKRGWQVMLKQDTDEFEVFREYAWDMSRYQGTLGLFSSERPVPEREAEYDVCAERKYNEVVNGERSRKLLETQSRARLLFVRSKFLEDVGSLQSQEARLVKELEEYDVDPLLSSVPTPVRGKKSATGKARKPRERWTPRGMEVIYRSVEVGLSGARHGEGKDEYGEMAREWVRTEPQKWVGRRAGFQAWHLKRRKASREVTIEDVAEAYARASQWREKVEKCLEDFDRTHKRLIQYGQAYQALRREMVLDLAIPRRRKGHPEQRRTLEEILSERRERERRRQSALEIHSGFYRLINRRYQPTCFWPPYVSAKRPLPETRDEGSLSRDVAETVASLESYRRRWFKARDTRGQECDLVGVDVSSSQTQIIVALLGLKKVEEILASGKAWKRVLTEDLWRRHEQGELRLRDGYSGAEDTRLEELAKNLWMRILYGSPLYQIVTDQWEDRTTFGPGIGYDDALRFLERQPGYAELKEFLEACKHVAKVAFKGDPYAGVIFKDPFDGVDVRWNPVRRAESMVKSEGHRVWVSLPGRTAKGRFIPNRANAAGDFPVDPQRLQRMVAPCLVHMLDAFFSSLVMERLADRGVHDFVGIHDCWLVPERVQADGVERSGREVLREVIGEASVLWLQGLGPTYDGLRTYLGETREYGTFVTNIQRQWENRVREGAAFQFRVKET